MASRLYRTTVQPYLAIRTTLDRLGMQRVMPSLTTVRLPIRELGVAAAEMLIEIIQTGKRPASRLLQANLVIRESSVGVGAG